MLSIPQKVFYNCILVSSIINVVLPLSEVSFREFMIFSKYMRLLYVVIFCILIGFVAPYLLDLYVYDSVYNDYRVAGTCHIKAGVRSNCAPETNNITEEECLYRGCCFQPLNIPLGAPVCHHALPSLHTLSFYEGGGFAPNEHDLSVFSWENATNEWPLHKYNRTAIRLRQVEEGHVAILIFDRNNEPDIDLGQSIDFKDVSITLRSTTDDGEDEDPRVRIKVNRNDGLTNPSLLDSSYGSLILGEELSEISLLMPTTHLYGMGGHPFSFGGNKTFTNSTLYNSDPRASYGQDLQHSHPTLLAMDETRKYYGVLMETERPLTIEALPGLSKLNSSATNNPDLEIRTGDEARPLLVFRSMGGYMLLHLFTGPEPKQVITQMSNYQGLPKKPPVSAMGYHVCRRTNKLGAFDHNWEGMQNASIPFDSDCIDEQLVATAFEVNNATHYQSDLQKLYETTTLELVVSHPVQTSVNFQDYGSADYVRDRDDNIVIGTYDSHPVSIPDFESDVTVNWWKRNIQTVLTNLEHNGNKPSGLVMIHNSPYLETEDSCNLTSTGFVPWEIRSHFGTGSLCPTDVHDGGIDHLTAHQEYSYKSTQATTEQMTDMFTFTKHSIPGTSGIAGIFGSEYDATWENLKQSLREVMELGLAGNPMVSMTACGTRSVAMLNTSAVVDELCLRWYQVAAYMPALNSYYGTEQVTRMPYTLTGAYKDWIRRALDHRLRLLPHFYTLLHEASLTGLPVIRPLFLEFPNDFQAWDVDFQFMVGDAILVSPVMDFGVTRLTSYFPHGTWYALWSGQAFQGEGIFTEKDDIPYEVAAHLKAGKVLPIVVSNEIQFRHFLGIIQRQLKFFSLQIYPNLMNT